MGELLAVTSLIVLIAGFIGVLNPRWIRLKTRLQAMGLGFFGLLIMVFAGALLEPKTPPGHDDNDVITDTKAVTDEQEASSTYFDLTTRDEANANIALIDELSRVDYQIIKDESMGTMKRSVDVELSATASEAALSTFAQQIKALNPDFERIFISYYIKDQQRDIYWATTHYNPDLKVFILDSTSQ